MVEEAAAGEAAAEEAAAAPETNDVQARSCFQRPVWPSVYHSRSEVRGHLDP